MDADKKRLTQSRPFACCLRVPKRTATSSIVVPPEDDGEPHHSSGLHTVPISTSIPDRYGWGSTGDPPVPSGDSPDSMGVAVRANGDGLFPGWLSAVPVGGSLTGTGESPALPVFKTRSQSACSGSFKRGLVTFVQADRWR